MQKPHKLGHLKQQLPYLLYILTIISLNNHVTAQKLTDYVFSDNIRTVQLHTKESELSYPVIRKGGNQELLLSFDDLDGGVKNYQFAIIHCNADWTKSNALPSDYMDGFFENPIENYRFSFNTFVSYTHYSLTLPLSDTRLNLPGNYVIKVFENYDQGNIVLTRRFMVAETAVHIEARVHQPRNSNYHHTHQQVSFTVKHPQLSVRNPHSEFFVSVIQNGRRDNAASDVKPAYIRNAEVVYEDDEKLIFPAGNEFRVFDTKNLRYRSEFIMDQSFIGDLYHIHLRPSEPRTYSRFFTQQDINGRFMIRNQEGRDPAIDADYVNVNFSIPWDHPFTDRDVYVYGALSDWNLYDRNRMHYNYDNRNYELELLLKQGYYNYQFVLAYEDTQLIDPSVFEGDYYETVNEYLITVYYRRPGDRFDRLIGVAHINSSQ